MGKIFKRLPTNVKVSKAISKRTSLKHRTVKDSKNIMYSSEESILNQIGINQFNNGETSTWRGMLWMERHTEISQNSKSWLYSKSSDFALECHPWGCGGKCSFSLSCFFISFPLSSSGWFLLLRGLLNPIYICALHNYFQNLGSSTSHCHYP